MVRGPGTQGQTSKHGKAERTQESRDHGKRGIRKKPKKGRRLKTRQYPRKTGGAQKTMEGRREGRPAGETTKKPSGGSCAKDREDL